MQYTPNYNMTIAEGTDVVNPLTQIFPNFSEIDTQMYANKGASIGRATEVKTGTVHSITRSNVASDNICFTATGDWNAGDSMVIDGTPVSVYLSDGTAPETGAYVINSEVFLVVNGSRATLMTSDSSVYGTVLASVTADGVKTYSQLYNELFAAINLSDITPHSVMRSKNNYLNLIAIGVDNVRFAFMYVFDTYAGMSESQLSAASYRKRCIVNGNGASFGDESGIVPTAGDIFAIYN